MALFGSVTQICVSVVLLAGLYFLLRKFINLTKISKASTYGKKE
jgi:hypothetical protein